MNILIAECDTPDLVGAALVRGGLPLADHFGALLEDLAEVEVETIAPYDGESLSDIAFYDGVVFPGSNVPWAVDDARARPLARLMEQALAAGLPVWGSCHGMQLAAVVLGGAVSAAGKGIEAGLARGIALTPEGRGHPMMAGRPGIFCAPCLHRDEVTRLPDGSVLLAGNAHCAVQAFVHAREGVDVWGVQYSPEYEVTEMPGILARAGITGAVIEDLRAAASGDTAALRPGAEAADLQPGPRTTELRNWLAHVQGKERR